MPFVPAPNIMMVEWRCTRSGQKVENRVMVNNQGAVAQGDLNDMAVLCWDWWENNHSVELSNQITLNEVVVTDQTTLNGGQFIYAPDSTTTGQNTSTPLPNEVSLCVSLRTASRGRSARGRWYYLSVGANQMVDPNNVTVAFAAAAAASLNALRLQLNAEAKPLTIVSYRTNNAPRVGGPVYFPVTGATIVDTVVDSMKRRKPGVGT